VKPLLVFIASALILTALAVAFPHVMLNPGQLTEGHKTLDDNCLACHTPFRGATSVQCISCHKQSDISVKTVAGALLPIKSSNALFHKGLADNSCNECHTDHKGRVAKKALKTFKHESLSRSISNNCITCHTNQRPKDALHKFAKGNCTECHTTKRWKPATFDHNRYFGLDSDHKASCKTCHTDPGNYKQYTCYNCHEHSLSIIAAEHRKEGISNYQNCMKCHRDGKAEEREDD